MAQTSSDSKAFIHVLPSIFSEKSISLMLVPSLITISTTVDKNALAQLFIECSFVQLIRKEGDELAAFPSSTS